jgi:NADH-quinone oxidoreductase subunit N
METLFNFKPVEFDATAVLPLAILIVTGLIALTIEMIRPKAANGPIVVATLIGLVLTGGGIIGQYNLLVSDWEAMGGMIFIDRFGLITQFLIVLATFLATMFSEPYLRTKRIPFGEFYPLLVWSAAGGMLMCSTRNLLMMFLGLEVLSIALYVLVGLCRQEEKSEESALKYFLLGAFASGFLLYGIAFTYGATGSLDLNSIGLAWQTNAAQTQGLLLFGLAMLLIGLGFKCGFVPFHQWTPDVYQGAPTNVTAFMAATSKIAALAALWRVLDGAMIMRQFWMPPLFWIAILTMTVGNLLALVQRDVKRVLGYSSIAHAGYILVAILARFNSPDKIGPQTVCYYLLIYTLMTVGAFAVVTLCARKGEEDTSISDLAGLRRRSPLAAGALIVFMLSLAGVPPFSGFFGKYMIFNDAVTAGLQPLAIVLAVNSVISLYYYLGIAKAAFVDEAPGEAPVALKLTPELRSVFALCVAGIIAGTLFFSPIAEAMTKAPQESVGSPPSAQPKRTPTRP